MNRSLSHLSTAVATLIESGLLTPAQARALAIRDWHRTKEAREAIAGFRQRWQAIPAHR